MQPGQTRVSGSMWKGVLEVNTVSYYEQWHNVILHEWKTHSASHNAIIYETVSTSQLTYNTYNAMCN